MTTRAAKAASAATAIDWPEVGAELDAHGWASLGRLLGDADADRLIAGYGNDALYRSHVVMARHGFGSGEYKYFAYPLPDPIADLRTRLYPPLAEIADRWAERLGGARFPETHAAFLEACRAEGQARPTPLILRYGAGDFNALHQDLYGSLAFPLQIVVLLSEPSAFEGGEFVLTEQRPRMQSRAEVVPLRRGEGVVFAVNERPREGARGPYRVKQRHGVSRLRRGSRFTLGIIFHDAA